MYGGAKSMPFSSSSFHPAYCFPGHRRQVFRDGRLAPEQAPGFMMREPQQDCPQCALLTLIATPR
jgi:hypothetical protein